jgi:hypothetical protein
LPVNSKMQIFFFFVISRISIFGNGTIRKHL